MKAVSTAQYGAFISYSQAADGKLAPALQTAIQKYAKPWYRLRAVRVFRDQTGLAVTPELWGSIERALQDSDYFLLLASPQAARSKWVEEELDWWLRNRSADRVLIACTDGELSWDAVAGDFDWAKTNALPRRLQKAFQQEPLYLDLRWAKSNLDLSLRRPQFADVVARLAATIRGLSLDEILGEDVRQHRVSIRLVRAAALALVLLTAASLFAMFVALQARRSVEPLAKAHETNALIQANQRTSQKLAAAALQQRAFDSDLSILLAAEALRTSPTIEAERALRQCLAGPLEPVLTLRAPPLPTMSYAALSGDGAKVITWGGTTVRIWNAQSGKLLLNLPGFTKEVCHAGFAGTNTLFCTAAEDDSVRVWDLKTTGNTVLTVYHKNVAAALMSPDSTRLLTLAPTADAVLWDAKAGTELARLEYSESLVLSDQVRDACFAPTGRYVAFSSRGDAVLLDAKTGKELFKLQGHSRSVASIGFSPDGTQLISSSYDHTIRRWRTKTGQCEAVLEHNSPILQAGFSPDGRWIAGRDQEQAIQIWDAASGRKTDAIRIQPKRDEPLIYTFGPDGKSLLIGSFDRATAQLWEIDPATHLADLTAEEGEIRTLHFSPDGKRAIVGSYGAPARVYDTRIAASPADLLELARGRVSRSLTREERERFTGPPPLGP